MESKKIVDYIILYSSDTSNLRLLVLEKIKEGYVPQGGVSYGGGDYFTKYVQAMAKFEI